MPGGHRTRRHVLPLPVTSCHASTLRESPAGPPCAGPPEGLRGPCLSCICPALLAGGFSTVIGPSTGGNMKLKSMVLASTVALFAAGMAQAAPGWVGLTGGASIPTGDTESGGKTVKFSDVVKTGWNGGVTGTWGVGT